MPRFYLPQPPETDQEQALPDALFRHAVQVLRLREGDALTLFDGQGREYPAALTMVARREARMRVGAAQVVNRESALPVTLLQAVGKGERMDWAVQKATELGVGRIVPVISERCNVQLDDTRWEKKQAHWQAVIIAACEQCGRNRLPQLDPPLAFDAALAAETAALRLLFDPEAGRGFADLPPPASVALLVGPEGGFSAAENQRAVQAGFTALRIGPRLLRMETAAATVVAAVQTRWGDMR